MICSKGKLKRSDAQRIFPHFMWLLRDVTLEPTDKDGKPCHISDYIKQKVHNNYMHISITNWYIHEYNYSCNVYVITLSISIVIQHNNYYLKKRFLPYTWLHEF